MIRIFFQTPMPAGTGKPSRPVEWHGQGKASFSEAHFIRRKIPGESERYQVFLRFGSTPFLSQEWSISSRGRQTSASYRGLRPGSPDF